MIDEEQDNRKMLITRNFINALDYLIDSGRLKSVADFERITGFRQQRVTGMKKFLSEGSSVKGYFANTDHLAALHEMFGVSLKYLISGEKPILEPSPQELAKSNPVQDDSLIRQIREEVELIRERQKILSERFELLKEKITG